MVNTDPTTNEDREPSRRPFSFGISNLLMLIALVAVCLAWWGSYIPATNRKFDIAGPISVSYSIRTSATSTSGSKIEGVRGIEFRGDNIVLYTTDGGVMLPGSSLIDFRWSQE